MKPIFALLSTGAFALLFSSCGPLLIQAPPAQQTLPKQQEVIEVQPVTNPNTINKPQETVTSASQKDIREATTPTYSTTTSPVDTPRIPTVTPSNLPVAQAIPSRPGWVFNPYNNNPVFVEGIPSGKTVLDPKDPNPDHKFRIP